MLTGFEIELKEIDNLNQSTKQTTETNSQEAPKNNLDILSSLFKE